MIKRSDFLKHLSAGVAVCAVSASFALAQSTSVVVTGYDAYGQPYTRTITTNNSVPLTQQPLSYYDLPPGAKIVDPSAYASSSSSSGSASAPSASNDSTVIWNSSAPRALARKPGYKPFNASALSAASIAPPARDVARSTDVPGNYGSRPPQFVLMAFDGSKSLDMWRVTRKFAREEGVKFTYFISGVYLLQDKDGSKYRGPGKRRGRSDIGFGGTKSEVSQRLAQIRGALNDGHEIGSHLNGHFDGSKWSYEQWSSEMSQYRSLLRNAYVNNGLSEPSGWRDMVNNRMNKGLRAPLLGISSSFNAAARDFGYKYDTSRTNTQNYWPKKVSGVWNFPLANITMVGRGSRVLSMDYNFYAKQSGAKDQKSRSQEFSDQMYESYMRYFRSNYYGNRAPLHIGHHFSLWNGGAYWRAMKRFSREVCGRSEVRCVTYDEYRRYLNAQPSSKVNAFRSGNFTKLPRG